MPAATLQETLEFCQRVREAGGGNPIDALAPAVPVDPSACLVARNLNFNCRVMPADGEWGREDGDDLWVMQIASKDTRDRIAEALGLRPVEQPDENGKLYGVTLPAAIRDVARAFDEAEETAEALARKRIGESLIADHERLVPERIANLEAMLPLIEESVREALGLAGDAVTPDGKIIL